MPYETRCCGDTREHENQDQAEEYARRTSNASEFPVNIFDPYGEYVVSWDDGVLGLGVPVQFDLLYEDTIDVGIRMVSTRTNQVATYYVSKTHKDREGDVTHWTLLPIQDGPQRKNMNIMRTKVIIFND